MIHNYYYADGRLLRETYGSNILDFFYDQNGQPFAFKHNGTLYYYITNLQGDVIYILNSNGATVATYEYDPYGNIVSATGTMAEINPLRYRGYYYDTDTGFYYLQSRYYDPKICRFINADEYASTGQGTLGYNMFAYCNNNPIMGFDPCGTCVHNWKFYNCEKCDAFWNGVTTTIEDTWDGVTEWFVDAYDTITSVNQQQALLQTQITMQQNEMVADAAEYILDAYQQSCNQQEAQRRQEIIAIQSCFSTPERAKATGKVIGSGVLFLDACFSGHPLAIVGTFVLFAIEFVDAID